MTVGIVYGLEVVDVIHDQGKRRFVAHRSQYLAGERLIKFQPIGKAGERIGSCLKSKVLGQFLEFQTLVHLDVVVNPAFLAEEINQAHERNKQSNNDSQNATGEYLMSRLQYNQGPLAMIGIATAHIITFPVDVDPRRVYYLLRHHWSIIQLSKLLDQCLIFFSR